MNLKLAILALFSELIYLFLVIYRLKVPILDLHNYQHLLLVICCLLLLFALYFIFYFSVNWQRVNTKQLFFTISIFNITLLSVPFLTSNDLYSYIFQTRVWMIHGQNPYLVPFDNFPNDRLYPIIKTVWSSHTTLHGPLFVLIGGLINYIGHNNLNLVLYLFKLILVGATILSSYLIYLITKSKKAVYLFGVNPLIIFELSGNAHADSLLILFLFTSFYLCKKPLIGFLALTGSILIKYSTLIIAPLELIYIKNKNIKTALIAVLLGLIAAFIVFMPFWDGPDIFNYLLGYYHGKYISPSLGILVGEKIFGSYEISFNVNTVIFLLIALVLYIKFLQSKFEFSRMVFYSFILYWAYLLTKLSLVLTWDLTPLVALSSLSVDFKQYQKYAMAGIFFATIYSLGLYYFVQ